MVYSLHAVDFLDVNRFLCRENRVSYKAANTTVGGSALNYQKICWIHYPELNIRYQKKKKKFSNILSINKEKKNFKGLIILIISAKIT